eukprot:m.139564 g.139564  ORF g.139564 m.139564 type:complete len:760 (-) comp16090_c0_seq9:140-2419(-)
MDAISKSLNAIVANDCHQCQTLYQLLEENDDNQKLLATAIKSTSAVAMKVRQAVTNTIAGSHMQSMQSMLSACNWLCKTDSECTDALMDVGLMQAVASLLELLGKDFDAELAKSTLSLILFVTADLANQYKRAARATASKRFCSLMGDFMRTIYVCTDSLSVAGFSDLVSEVIGSCFKAVPADNLPAARELDSKLGKLIPWLVEQSTNDTLAPVLVRIIHGHEYIASWVDKTNAVQRVMEQVETGIAVQQVGGLGALWDGSDGIPGMRRVILHVDRLVKVARRSRLGAEMLENCIGIFSNIVKYSMEGSDDDRTALSQSELEEVCLDLCEQDAGQHLNESTRVDLYSAVANLVGSVEAHPRVSLLKINRALVDTIVGELRQALVNLKNAEPWEYMQPLANLAVVDDNKPFICDAALSMVLDVLGKESLEPKLEHYACKLLVQLALHQDKLPGVRAQSAHFLTIFQRLTAEGKLEATRYLAAVGQFQLRTASAAPVKSPKPQQKETRDHGQDQNTQQGHVMLSYAWAHQKVMLQLRDTLLAQGLRVWMDVDQMSDRNNIFESMAAAVEEASVVVVCISQEYAESANCRLECQYAHSHHIPMVPVRPDKGFKPAGWLGLIMSSTLWHDVNEALSQQQADLIVKAIRRNAPGVPTIPAAQSAPISPTHHAHGGTTREVPTAWGSSSSEQPVVKPGHVSDAVEGHDHLLKQLKVMSTQMEARLVAHNDQRLDEMAARNDQRLDQMEARLLAQLESSRPCCELM